MLTRVNTFVTLANANKNKRYNDATFLAYVAYIVITFIILYFEIEIAKEISGHLNSQRQLNHYYHPIFHIFYYRPPLFAKLGLLTLYLKLGKENRTKFNRWAIFFCNNIYNNYNSILCRSFPKSNNRAVFCKYYCPLYNISI